MCNFLSMKLLQAGAFVSIAFLSAAPARPEPARSPRVLDSYGKIPFTFESNQGQTDPSVRFLGRGPGYTLFLTNNAAILALRRQDKNAMLRMELKGSDPNAIAAGVDALPGKSNYFLGRDPSKWHTDVATYAAVKYTAVYPGIDLVYRGNRQVLEYDFLVAPSADPQKIDIAIQGASKLRVNREGALVIGLDGSEVIQHPPVIYQDIHGTRKTVNGRYVLRGADRVGFSLGEYDRSRPLVIDPVLVYSTYLGEGTSGNASNGIAVDASGNAYVTGVTASAANFPTTPGALQKAAGGGWVDVFVSKLNATGSALIYSTYLGGASSENATSIAVDASGNAYITGTTDSMDFPVTPGAYQTTGPSFVTKLNATGSALVYSTRFGGERSFAYAIAVDSLGNAYVTGRAELNFPTTPGAFQTVWGGFEDAFVSKFSPVGALIYSTYLGGAADDVGIGIAIDPVGNAYVAGSTASVNFPVTANAFQTVLRGYNPNAFVAKLNPAGSALVYSTFLAGSDGYSGGGAIAVDASGYAYLTGGTSSSNFPTTPGAFQTICHDDGDAYVTRLNPAGSGLVYSTCFGGTRVPDYSSGDEGGAAIAVDASGNAYITGPTLSKNLPTTPGAFQTEFAGYEDFDLVSDAFVAKFSPTGSLLYSSYLGGNFWDEGTSIAVDANGDVYVAGPTESAEFPVTPGAFRTTMPGVDYMNIFVTKLRPVPSTSTNPATVPQLNGVAGNDGWYRSDVTVSLNATAGSYPVAATYYAVWWPYLVYTGPFTISREDRNRLMYYTVDTAGQRETPHRREVKIDKTKPVSRVAPLPATSTSPNFSVQWSGTDNFSSMRSFTIYVSDNGGAYTPWLSYVTSQQAYYPGSLLHTYSFYSVAEDFAGNVESPKAAEATIRVPQMPGDVNGDGKINCADIAAVKASFGKRSGQTGFNPAADVNRDGIVDIRDLAAVSQKLAPGTLCP